MSPNRIGTRRIKFYLLDNSTVKHIAIFYFFFRFSWIDSAVFTAYCIQFLRKEVIQPHLPIRLPCYDFTPVIGPAFGSSFFAVRSLTSGVTDSHGVTGGVYKTRERIHGAVADAPLLAIPASCRRVAAYSPNWAQFLGFPPPRGFGPLCTGHCSTCAALGIRAILT